MTTSHPRVACMAVLAATLFASAAPAQPFSPYFETTGNEHYDRYNDATQCSAVLEREIEAAPDDERRPQLEAGIVHALAVALVLLESGTVVDMSGAILAPDNLPVDRRNARADWQAVLHSIEDEGGTPDAEIARCLDLHGQESLKSR